MNNGLIHAGWSNSDYLIGTDFPGSNYFYNYKTQTYNLGLELGLFQNRIHLTTDYYRKKTEHDQIFMSGPSAITKFQNKGWEFMVDYNLINKKDLKVDLYFNASHDENAIVSVPVVSNTDIDQSINNGEYQQPILLGQPRGSFYGFRYKGVYASDAEAVAHNAQGNVLMDGQGHPIPMTYNGTYTFRGGDAKYEDINHDGKIDLSDMVPLGNFFPKVTGGFGSTIQYKNLSLTCNFHYLSGYQIINQVAMDSEGLFSKNNLGTNVLNRWRVQGQLGSDVLPRAYLNHPANNLGSDRYVEDGSFIKMNYINLSYQFKSEFCQKIKIKDLTLSLSAQRAFTFTNYSGLDPETERKNNYSWNKDEMRTYPPKIFTLSFRITV